MSGALLPDVQDQADRRGIPIDRVGVAGLRYPVALIDDGDRHAGIATIEMTVGLPAERRGTHMSRMVAFVHDALREIHVRDLSKALREALPVLAVDSAVVTVRLPIAFEVYGPASGLPSMQTHDAVVEAAVGPAGARLRLGLTSHVTSLCPCSKAISDYGAHNQRSIVDVRVDTDPADSVPPSLRDLADLICSVGSAPVVPLVKRPDERVLTMLAHDNPAFVEDILRDLSSLLRERRLAHEISVRNIESIHSHDAVATLRWGARGDRQVCTVPAR